MFLSISRIKNKSRWFMRTHTLTTSVPIEKPNGIVKSKVLTKDTMSIFVRRSKYAVLGELPARAEEIKKILKTHPESFEFDKVVFCNIGNPHIFNQKPITFFRQVASLCENQDLLDKKNRELVSQLYPKDAIERAEILSKHIGPLGAYNDSQGVKYIRESIAQFIERRDGYKADPDTIFLTQGAGDGIQKVLGLLHQPQVQTTGVMIPIPQYPIYTAALQLIGAEPVPYFLDGNNRFALDITRLENSIRDARQKKINVRALAVINPGNPTGQCLSYQNIQDIIQFCHREELVILADEVYQDNVFERGFFHSFKKVLKSLGSDYKAQELISFHSISKGMVGECGRRGGYMECTNIDPDVLEELYKVFCIFSGVNIQGQIMVNLMTNPPLPNDPSYPQYKSEIDEIQSSYRRRAQSLTECFSKLEGVTCDDTKGAMYVFPRIRLPERAIKKAIQSNLSPDSLYAMELLNETGICVVPGSGFGQEQGKFHIRCSFLPEESLFDKLCKDVENFHKKFMRRYKD